MSKLQNENFFTIYGWMLNELHLKGNELLVYAVIYSFGDEGIKGGIATVQDWTGCSRNTTKSALRSLQSKGLIEWTYSVGNGRQISNFIRSKIDTVNFRPYQKLTGQELTFKGSKIDYGKGSKIAPSIYNSIKDSKRGIVKKHNKSIDYEKIKDDYNSTCKSLAKVTVLSENRKRAIKTIIDRFGEEKLQEVFRLSEESNFLRGDNNRGWQRSFDWLLKENNFVKVLDGNYKNRGNQQATDIAPEDNIMLRGIDIFPIFEK